MVKLLDYGQEWQALEDSLNPFATVVMAHLKALETKGNEVQRKDWKFNLTRRLYEKGYERQDVLNLFRFIDWVITLPQNLAISFRQELEQYEQERQMPYVTSIERMAIRQGLIDAIELGLELKFGTEALNLLPEITQIENIENLKEIREALKTVNSLTELSSIYQARS